MARKFNISDEVIERQILYSYGYGVMAIILICFLSGPYYQNTL
jgi:hypothetical protein